MRNLVVIGLACLTALPGCMPMAVPDVATLPDPVPPLSSQQSEPQLALLENALGDYFAAEITNRPTVCAAMHDGRADEALPPEGERALMERFPNLAPLSRCSLRNGMWIDADSEEPALVYTLHSFACASDRACNGWVGYRAGAAAGISSLYTMSWETGRWNFTRSQRALAQ